MWHCYPLNFTKLVTGEEKENDANRRKENTRSNRLTKTAFGRP